MAYQFRRALPADSVAIAEVQVESWRITYAGIVPSAFLAELDASVQAPKWADRLASGEVSGFVSENELGIAGFATGGPLREAVDVYDCELYAIYLLASAQRKGIGMALVRSLAAELFERGLKSMVVWVLEKNPSVGFYKSLGGIQVAQKTIDIGGAMLSEIAFGWPRIEVLLD